MVAASGSWVTILIQCSDSNAPRSSADNTTMNRAPPLIVLCSSSNSRDPQRPSLSERAIAYIAVARKSKKRNVERCFSANPSFASHVTLAQKEEGDAEFTRASTNQRNSEAQSLVLNLCRLEHSADRDVEAASLCRSACLVRSSNLVSVPTFRPA